MKVPIEDPGDVLLEDTWKMAMGSPFTWRQETVHPPEMPIAYPDIGGAGGYPHEPSIRNIEVWLDWQACQSDTPHWWVELTAIPDVENPKKLAWKICTSFLIPAVRCEAFTGQEYTVPPAPNVSPGICFSPVICLSGHLTAAFAADHGLCPSTAILGREI